MAWSCAVILLRDKVLMDGIAEAALAKLPEFTEQNLANTAWAFAKLI